MLTFAAKPRSHNVLGNHDRGPMFLGVLLRTLYGAGSAPPKADVS